jgi:signal transduction histidine kinase
VAAVRKSAEEYEGKGVAHRSDIEDGVPLVWVDRARIADILDRLLVNALDHSESGAAVSVDLRQEGEDVVFVVTDEGRGLDPAEIERVFEEFAQIDDIQNHSVGLGLSLSLARRMVVEGHGGRLWAESEGRGKGARFLLALPVRA